MKVVVFKKETDYDNNPVFNTLLHDEPYLLDTERRTFKDWLEANTSVTDQIDPGDELLVTAKNSSGDYVGYHFTVN